MMYARFEDGVEIYGDFCVWWDCPVGLVDYWNVEAHEEALEREFLLSIL
jgi:hypothetical protein